MTNYDVGANWEPSPGAIVGVKHESTNKSAVQLGRFWFYFFHMASARHTVGTEV